MSAKLRHRPFGTGHGEFGEKTPLDRLQPALRCIRQVQSSAERICRDAADIEDARFLAENIVDACRRMLAGGTGTASTPHRENGSGAGSAVLAVPASAGNAVEVTDAGAQETLECLSARELTIFTRLAEGRSAAEIASSLSLSSKTINNQRTFILRKLGLKNATELVLLAVRSGLVSV